MSDWSRRLWFTLGVVACAHALQFVWTPWLAQDEWDLEHVARGWLIAERESPLLGLAALGIKPLVSALALTTIAFAIVPKLRRRLRERDGELRLLRAAFVLSVVLAIVQSTGIALFLQNMSFEEPMFSDLELPQLLMLGATLVLFAALYAALPFALDRWGLGRGLSAAVLLYCLLTVADAVHALVFDIAGGDHGVLKPGDAALLAIMVAGTVAAVRKWVGDTDVLPGDPRLDRVGSSLSVALIVLVGINGLGGELLVRWAAFGDFGSSLIELCVAVGGGLLLASGQRDTSSDPPIVRNKLLALGTFIVLLALATILLTDRLVMPWTEIVVATILIYMSWRASRPGPAAEPEPLPA